MRLFLGLFVLLVGCGGSEGGVGAPAADGGPVGVDDSGTVTPEGGADGAVAPIADGGDAGDAKAKDNRIDPVELGRSWTYDVSVIGLFPACANGSFSATAVSQSTIDGKAALHVESFCKGAGAYDYSVDGDRVYSYLANSWRTSLDAPVAAGHEWTDGFLTYRWESKGSVTTPAGTFSECWSATTVASYSSYIVLCRGVGPVKWHYDTGFGNGYDAILTAKNF
jgi:hypothetical protein